MDTAQILRQIVNMQIRDQVASSRREKERTSWMKWLLRNIKRSREVPRYSRNCQQRKAKIPRTLPRLLNSIVFPLKLPLEPRPALTIQMPCLLFGVSLALAVRYVFGPHRKWQVELNEIIRVGQETTRPKIDQAVCWTRVKLRNLARARWAIHRHSFHGLQIDRKRESASSQ